MLRAEHRTPGPVGFSLLADDVQVSLRDLVPPMLTVSDNVATDALLDRIGIDAVNGSLAALGLHHTVITTDLRTTIDSIGRDAGFTGWDDLQRWWAEPHPAEDIERARVRLLAARQLQPGTATRTTARDMATLLRFIWRDEAAPAAVCQRVRSLMGLQLSRDRLARAFPPPARVLAKSGGLAGIVRNEVGVVEYPDGRGYATAVFTRDESGEHERQVDAAIGQAAAEAVDHLSKVG